MTKKKMWLERIMLLIASTILPFFTLAVASESKTLPIVLGSIAALLAVVLVVFLILKDKREARALALKEVEQARRNALMDTFLSQQVSKTVEGHRDPRVPPRSGEQ